MKSKLNKMTILGLSSFLSTFMIGCGSGGSDNDNVVKPIETIKCAERPLADGASCITLDNRDIIIYKPDENINGVALFLHGEPGNPNKINRMFDAKLISDSHKLLSATPQGNYPDWGWNSLNNGSTSNEDVDLLVELLSKLRAENNITSDKVYVFGYSAGGFMAYKLACEIPEKITAIVSVAGQFRGDFNECTTSTPITLHHFHSPNDTEVPIAGRGVGLIKSVSDTMEHWRIINGCSEISTTVEHPKVINSSQGTTTQIWQGCVKSTSFSQMDNVPHESQYNAEVLRQIYAPIFN